MDYLLDCGIVRINQAERCDISPTIFELLKIHKMKVLGLGIQYLEEH